MVNFRFFFFFFRLYKIHSVGFFSLTVTHLPDRHLLLTSLSKFHSGGCEGLKLISQHNDLWEKVCFSSLTEKCWGPDAAILPVFGPELWHRTAQQKNAECTRLIFTVKHCMNYHTLCPGAIMYTNKIYCMAFVIHYGFVTVYTIYILNTIKVASALFWQLLYIHTVYIYTTYTAHIVYTLVLSFREIFNRLCQVTVSYLQTSQIPSRNVLVSFYDFILYELWPELSGQRQRLNFFFPAMSSYSISVSNCAMGQRHNKI